MEMLQLRYFYETSKNENIAATAEKHMVPSTSVSASIKRLEKELGCTLFDRTANRIILNGRGKKLQQSLDIIFTELDTCVASLSQGKEDYREVKILVLSMRRIITGCIIDFKKVYPHIHFKTSFEYGTVDPNEYDIIIDDTPKKYVSFDSTILCRSNLRLKVARSSPLCGRKLTLHELRNEPFVTMSENGRLHAILMRACQNAGFTPKIAARINDLNCYHQFLTAGLGIGLGRDMQDETNSGLCYLDVQDFHEQQTIYCYCNRRSNYGNVRQFVTFLAEQSLQQHFYP